MTLLRSSRAALDVQTVTTGTSGTAPAQDRLRGFSGGLGSIDDGTSNIYSGAAVTTLMWDENGGGGAQRYVLEITGATNTGWITLTIQSSAGTATLLRASGTFSSGQWLWTTTDVLGTQAFGGLNTVVTCTFT